MSPNSHRYTRGFTLVEILIVVVLVGILAGMSLPSFIKAQRYAKVTNNSNALYTGLSRARAIAMRKQRPVLITVTTTTPGGVTTLTFTAVLDANYSSVPGPDAGDQPLLSTDSPFPSGSLVLAAREFSFGFPTTTSSFSVKTHNLNGINWFGFDASGKLIPNGQTPFSNTTTYPNQTILPSNPDNTIIGGPEFYFAEAGAANITQTNSHTYRKIEINSFGAIRTLAWNTQMNQWKGVQ